MTALLLSLAALGVALACAVHCARVQGTTDEAECTVRACASDDAPA